MERNIRCCWLHVLHPSSTLLISEPDELLWDWLTYGISLPQTAAWTMMSREDVHLLGVAYTGCLACAPSAKYSLVHERVFGLSARLMTRCGWTGGFARNGEIEGGIDEEVEAHILGILTHGISYSYSKLQYSVFSPFCFFRGAAPTYRQ